MCQLTPASADIPFKCWSDPIVSHDHRALKCFSACSQNGNQVKCVTSTEYKSLWGGGGGCRSSHGQKLDACLTPTKNCCFFFFCSKARVTWENVGGSNTIQVLVTSFHTQPQKYFFIVSPQFFARSKVRRSMMKIKKVKEERQCSAYGRGSERKRGKMEKAGNKIRSKRETRSPEVSGLHLPQCTSSVISVPGYVFECSGKSQQESTLVAALSALAVTPPPGPESGGP